MLPIVQRPLAAVIARDASGVRAPKDLEGKTVGVTGLPSDEAVVDSEVSADGGDPAKVHQVTIGFNAVASLAAGNVDAATGFWNAEGVALRDARACRSKSSRSTNTALPPTRSSSSPPPSRPSKRSRSWSKRCQRATKQGYDFTVEHPNQALDDLLAADPALESAEQDEQLKVLRPDLAAAPRSTRASCTNGPPGTSSTACSHGR